MSTQHNSQPGTASASYILYAEDNISDATFFKRALKQVDPEIRVVHLENGSLALKYLEDCLQSKLPLPRVAVLDIKMPGMTGLEVLEHVRANDQLKRLPVVLLSASYDHRDVDAAYRMHVNAYLAKPGKYKLLKELLQSLTVFWMRYNRLPT